MTDSAMPIQKVTNSFIAGSITVVFVWILHQYGHIEIPDYVSGAITGLIMSFTAWATPVAQAEMALWVARARATQAALAFPAPPPPPAAPAVVVANTVETDPPNTEG